MEKPPNFIIGWLYFYRAQEHSFFVYKFTFCIKNNPIEYVKL